MDRNFFNITGDDKGTIWINDVLTFSADEPGIRELDIGNVVPPAMVAWSDALKLSGLRRVKIRATIVDGHLCEEDAVDINHCEDVELIVTTLYAGRTYGFTIKGGSKRVRIEVGDFINHGRVTDIDLGNFSDQGNPKTTAILLNLTSHDKSPIKVRLLTADKPAIENASQAYEITGGGAVSKWFYPLFDLWKGILKLFKK